MYDSIKIILPNNCNVIESLKIAKKNFKKYKDIYIKNIYDDNHSFKILCMTKKKTSYIRCLFFTLVKF